MMFLLALCLSLLSQAHGGSSYRGVYGTIDSVLIACGHTETINTTIRVFCPPDVKELAVEGFPHEKAVWGEPIRCETVGWTDALVHYNESCTSFGRDGCNIRGEKGVNSNVYVKVDGQSVPSTHTSIKCVPLENALKIAEERKEKVQAESVTVL